MNTISLDKEYIDDFFRHVASQIGVTLVSWFIVTTDGKELGHDDLASVDIEATSEVTPDE